MEFVVVFLYGSSKRESHRRRALHFIFLVIIIFRQGLGTLALRCAAET